MFCAKALLLPLSRSRFGKTSARDSGEISVDGGRAYIRRSANDLSNIIELSVFEDETV
jgi:hypothetical protein